MRSVHAVVLATALLGAAATLWGSGAALSRTADELIGETCIIPDASPFKVPVKYAATFGHDEGVVFSSGEALHQVSEAPGPQEYSVSAGIYVFNAVDHGKGVLISYTLTPPARP
jgi:hypothetical protein